MRLVLPLAHRLLEPCIHCGRWGGGVLCKACEGAPPSALSLGPPRGNDEAPPLSVLHLGAFAGPLAERIRRLKYSDETYLAESLGRALARRYGTCLRGTVLIPVPLHPERLAERGYNQSALVARAVARSARATVNVNALVRVERTRAQARLGRTERRTNVMGAFVASAGAATLSGRPVVLVDDVVTTGSTLRACQAALEAAGIPSGLALSIAAADQGSRGERSGVEVRPARWPESP